MDIHEYQAKQLFKEYGIDIPKGIVVTTLLQALESIDKLQNDKLVVKAQIYAGGRGQSNGVIIVDGKKELEKAVKCLLNKNLITAQTSSEGLLVEKLLIEPKCEIERFLYLSMLIDPVLKQIVILASSEGGGDIENLLKKNPEKVLKIVIDDYVKGITEIHGKKLSSFLNIDSRQSIQFSKIITSMLRLFIENDLSLIEINPLAIINSSDEFVCIDGKINIDDNALYRQPKLLKMFDPSQYNKNELIAHENGFSYIPLGGNIGCIVNGAGLAMATMDEIVLNKGTPLNFLDIGGNANNEAITNALKILLLEKNAKVILVNIFGGIVRCDDVAKGIIDAILHLKINIPLVVRFDGNRASEALSLLTNSGLDVIVAYSFQEACKKAVDIANYAVC